MMAYITNLKAMQVAGLDNKVVDENIGTGDNSETSFDLKNDNVLTSSYTISYASSGSNDFTALTETTHYVLDKNSGRIELTGAGVTALSTNVLYGTYSYTTDITDTEITNFVTFADEEANKLTGREWGTVTEYVEYFDGRGLSGYPSSEHPYDSEYDVENFLMLNNYPVTKINQVYFLERGSSLTKVYSLDGSTYTDNTVEANSSEGTASFYVFASVPAVGDIIYFGSSYKFLGLEFRHSMLGTGSPAIDWEYYNSAGSWSDITETEIDTGASIFTADGKFVWDLPDNWGKVSVNSSAELYYVRGKVGTGYTQSPKLWEAWMDQDSIVGTYVNNRGLDFTSYGKLVFNNISIPDGERNVKVKYNAGTSTIPSLVEELSGILVSIRCFVKLSGGSYDAYTSVSSSAVSATIGEQYVNIREVIVQFKKRVEEIVRLLGGRADLEVVTT